VVLDLATSRWAQQHQNIIFTGYTGVGKSYLACALGQKACRDGFSVVYRRTSRLFNELTQGRADGTHPHLLRRLAKAQVLILDDFGLEPLGPSQRTDLLEVLDDRYKVGSTIITSRSSQTTGTRSSATRRSRTPSATASSTTHIGSSCPASRFGRPRP
jgi:DNA replication protein DnaC